MTGHSGLRMAVDRKLWTEHIHQVMAGAGLAPEGRSARSTRVLVPVPSAEENLGVTLELLLLRGQDVPIYVEHGVADVGVAASEVLYELRARVFRPFTFATGRMPLVLAAPTREREDLLHRPMVRIATPYMHFARDHFGRRGLAVRLIQVSGSAIVAPGLGLADAILDKVSSETILQENDLAVLDIVDHTSIKLIANRAIGVARAEVIERLGGLLAASEPNVVSGG